MHLVTLGAILNPLFAPGSVNAVRDAYFEMSSTPVVLPGMTPTIRPVPHHYDLPHVDLCHLTPCGYATLANRIADGILFPADVPRLTASPVSIDPNGFDIGIATTTPLTAMGFAQSANALFQVEVAGAAVPSAGFQIGTNGNDVIVRILAGGLTPTTPVTIGHVRASGDGLNWAQTVPVIGLSTGMPLEPFITH